uniref:Thiolase N-terminal domain-containing protein n=1 Tax=Panagrolaimus sp. JU765 TaxID=591449 RepID=A0AC34RHC3_9BILA
MSSSPNNELPRSSTRGNPIPAGKKVVRSELQGILPSLVRQQAPTSNVLELPQPMEYVSHSNHHPPTASRPNAAGDIKLDFVSELRLSPKMTKLEDVYIVSAVRTPIASFRGSFKTLTSVDLGVIVAKEAISRAGIKPENVEETITGSVLTANCGQNVSRQIALKSGIPESSNAFTVNKVCSSSLKALILATQSQQLGVRKISLVVGTE